MSYRIEITAASVAELIGKVTALAAELQPGQCPVMPEVKEVAEKVAPKPRKAAEPRVEAAPEPKEAPAPEPEQPKAEEPQQDFTAAARELVMALTAKKGRDAVVAIVSQFGVERATQVAEDQRDELLANLRDALEG